MRIRAIIVAVLAIMLAPVLSMAGNVVLIGHPSITASTLSQRDVGKIFLGKKIAWDDNTKIVIALQNNTTIHGAFLKEYIHKSPPLFANYWRKLVFTGKVLAPNTFDSDEEMIKFVSETKGAIGYVSAETGLEKVKIIKVK